MKKFFLIAISIAVLLSCSSSGGGGESSDATPTPTTPAPGSGNTPFNAKDPHNVQGARDKGMDGKGVTIGIIDSSFNINSPEFLGSDGKSRLSKNSGFKGNTNMHGSLVSEIIGGKTNGIANNVNIKGVEAGTVCSDGSDRCLIVSKAMYDSLYADGVRIFNQSFGTGNKTIKSVTKSDMPLTDPQLDFYYRHAITDSLFIWATGNNGATDPLAEAGLPYLYPEMKKGWIAVTAVDSSTGIISSYANKCGVAAEWCVAAVGDYTFKVVSATGEGTSFAAPVVTGTAALVKQKYPWMNGDLIRQTILSTATDMGDSGVDEVYGWGLVNAGKAVMGPARFDKRLALGDYVNVNFDTDVSTFENNIAGDAGLIKDGTGTLILVGTNTYTGKNVIKNGILKINGVVQSGVLIDASGVLSGDGGVIKSDVSSDGGTILSNGKSLTIEGSYSAVNNSNIIASTDSILKIEGTASLDDTNLILTTPVDSTGNATYISGANTTKSQIITAGKGIINRFSTVNVPTLLDAGVSYESNVVEVSLKRKNVSEYVNEVYGNDATRNNSAQNVEQVFEKLDTTVEGGEFMARAAELQQITLGELTAALDSLSGQIYAS